MGDVTEHIYPEMFQNYIKFCEMRKQFFTNEVINLSEGKWYYPTTLLLLGGFITNYSDKMNLIKPKNPNVSRYVDIMIHGTPRGSSFPLSKLPIEKDKVENALQSLYNLPKQQEVIASEEVFKYILGELIDNMYEHAGFTNAFCMAQLYKKMKFLEVCFFDDGITIPGNFEKYGLLYKNHAKALVDALKGLSTKKESGRGCGLGTSIRLLVEGLKSQVLLISNEGALHLDENHGPNGYILPKSYNLKGTLISARVPFPIKKVNIYDYISK